MKRKFAVLILCCLVLSICYNPTFKAYAKSDITNNPKVQYSDSTTNRGQLQSIVPDQPSYSTIIDEGGGGGGEVVIYVTYMGIQKMFIMTQHAVERIGERFYGNYETIANILKYGDIYADIEHGGYVAYYANNAVCLASDLTIIKTVEDGVSIWDKLKSAIWAIQYAIESIW